MLGHPDFSTGSGQCRTDRCVLGPVLPDSCVVSRVTIPPENERTPQGSYNRLGCAIVAWAFGKEFEYDKSNNGNRRCVGRTKL